MCTVNNNNTEKDQEQTRLLMCTVNNTKRDVDVHCQQYREDCWGALLAKQRRLLMCTVSNKEKAVDVHC